MSSKGSDILQDYEEMVKNPENHSLFDLVNLLQRVKKETNKLDKEEREQRAIMAKKADGTTYCFLEKNLMRKMKLENAEKKLEQMIAEAKNGRK